MGCSLLTTQAQIMTSTYMSNKPASSRDSRNSRSSRDSRILGILGVLGILVVLWILVVLGILGVLGILVVLWIRGVLLELLEPLELIELLEPLELAGLLDKTASMNSQIQLYPHCQKRKWCKTSLRKKGCQNSIPMGAIWLSSNFIGMLSLLDAYNPRNLLCKMSPDLIFQE